MSFWNKFEKPTSDTPSAVAQPPRVEPTLSDPPPAPSPSQPMVERVEPAPRAEATPPPVAPTVPAAPAAPAARAGPPPTANDLRLGRGVRLEGKLTFSGTVTIDATFQGSIVTDGVLVIGELAKVDAEIACGTVIVEGEVNGNVVASAAVELRATGRLRGDVETPSLVVERGALLDGASRRPRGTASSDRRAGKAAAAPAHN